MHDLTVTIEYGEIGVRVQRYGVSAVGLVEGLDTTLRSAADSLHRKLGLRPTARQAIVVAARAQGMTEAQVEAMFAVVDSA